MIEFTASNTATASTSTWATDGRGAADSCLNAVGNPLARGRPLGGRLLAAEPLLRPVRAVVGMKVVERDRHFRILGNLARKLGFRNWVEIHLA